MTQEEKDLLLKDLCARLPYGNTEIKVTELTNDMMGEVFVGKHICSTIDIEDFILGKYIIRPYLRPLPSMTDEEKKELSRKYNWKIRGNQISIRYHSEGYWDDDTECPTEEYLKLFDWLKKNHFDYRGLITMGIALPATEDMYKN